MNILERHEARKDPSGFWLVLTVVLMLGGAGMFAASDPPTACVPWAGDVATLFSKLRC